MSWPKFDLGDFPQQTKESWKKKVIADLKGKPYEDLSWEVDKDLILDCMYTDDEGLEIIRIPARAMQSDTNEWLIHQDFKGLGSKMNAEILEALKNGVNSIGLTLSDLHENPKALDGVYQNMLRLRLDCSISDFNKSSLKDQIKTLDFSADYSALVLDVFTEKEVSKSLIVNAISEIKNIYSWRLKLNVSVFTEAGFGPVDALALAALKLTDLLDLAAEAGVDEKTLYEHLEVELCMGRSYLADVGLIRSMRAMLNKVLRMWSGDIKAEIPVFIQANSARFNLSRLDAYNGLLRGTIAGMSATIGGADAVMIRPFDELWANSAEALRYARNTQHLLKEESMLDAVQDPMKGALIVEKLCAKLLEAGWNKFQKWSDEGTYLELLSQGVIENAAEKAAAHLQKQLDEQSLILLGVNKYSAPHSSLPEMKALEAAAEIKAFRWAEKHESKSEKA